MTKADWLRANFWPAPYELFFGPFHQLYIAGLCDRTAPQDGYKPPYDLGPVLQGAFDGTAAVGYSTTFVYPEEGLNVLAQPLNLGTDHRVTVDQLFEITSNVAGKNLRVRHDLSRRQGVRGRNSDSTRLEKVLGWQPRTPLEDGLATTYQWIEEELRERGRVPVLEKRAHGAV